MHLPWRRNPKTPDGWPRRAAIALLAGLATFLVSLPVSFLLFLDHYGRLYPGDPQNFLGALTSAVVVGLALALLILLAALALQLVFASLRPRPTNTPANKPSLEQAPKQP